MAEYAYRVSAVSFGMGFQSGSTRTLRLNEHLREVAADGWRLVAVDKNMFEFPIVWRCFWERPAGSKSSDPEIA